MQSSVRVWDVHALLVEFYSAQGNNQLAYQLIEKMRERNIVLSYYLEQKLVCVGVGGTGRAAEGACVQR